MLEELRDSEKYYLSDELLTEKGAWNTLLQDELYSRTNADVQAGQGSYAELSAELAALEEMLRGEGLTVEGDKAQRWKQLRDRAAKLSELEKQEPTLPALEEFSRCLEETGLPEETVGGLLQRKLEQLPLTDLRELLEWPESCNRVAGKYGLTLPALWKVPDPWSLLCKSDERRQIHAELEKLAAHGLLNSHFRVKAYGVEAQAETVLPLLDTAEKLPKGSEEQKEALLSTLKSDKALEGWFWDLFRGKSDYLLLLFLKSKESRSAVLNELETQPSHPSTFWSQLPLKELPLKTVEKLFHLRMREYEKDQRLTKESLKTVLRAYYIAGLSIEQLRSAEPKRMKGAVENFFAYPPLPVINGKGD